MTLKEIVKTKLAKRRWSQVILANQIGMSLGTLYNALHDPARYPEAVEKIKSYLRIP